MFSSLTNNLGQPLARLAQVSVDNFPAIQRQSSQKVEADFRAYLDTQFNPQIPEARIQRLLRHSLDSELFAETKADTATKQAANGLARAGIRQAYGFAILQEQFNLLGRLPTRTLGAG